MNPSENSRLSVLQLYVLPHQVDKAPRMQDSTDTAHGLALDELIYISKLEVDAAESLTGGTGKLFPGIN